MLQNFEFCPLPEKGPGERKLKFRIFIFRLENPRFCSDGKELTHGNLLTLIPNFLCLSPCILLILQPNVGYSIVF